jgi:two-component system chemotaxis family response regulator WspR
MEESRPATAPTGQPDAPIVLLVDDQALVGEAVRRMLADQSDIQFHYCGNAVEALATAQQVHPTVILQDLIMPGVDGLTLVSQYRAAPNTANVPIIVLSSKEEPATKRDAFRGGANDYLVKLPDKIELVARIRLHSEAYLTKIQRDAAYLHLHESQRELLVSNTALAARIDELQATRDELARLVSTDALTGACSRRRWFECATTEFARYRRYGRPLAFLMADLDFFKRINDTYGHETGDDVLRGFAGVLRAVCRESDLAGRVGGEEFAVMLPETSAGGAQDTARRIVEACRSLEVVTPLGRVNVSCSIGVAAAIPGATSVEDVLREADAALYDAKRSGRDTWKPSAKAAPPTAG